MCAYDAIDQLTGVTTNSSTGTTTQTSAYEYDPLTGRRTVLVDSGVLAQTQLFAYDPNTGNSLLTLDGMGNVTEVDLPGQQPNQPLYDSNVGWLINTTVGSVSDTIVDDGDRSGHVTYDSFGNVTGHLYPGGSVRFGFAGMVQDAATGQLYDDNRYYDPAQGAFVTADPAGFGGGDYNLYRYCGGDPASETDPTGLSPTWGIEATPSATGIHEERRYQIADKVWILVMSNGSWRKLDWTDANRDGSGYATTDYAADGTQVYYGDPNKVSYYVYQPNGSITEHSWFRSRIGSDETYDKDIRGPVDLTPAQQKVHTWITQEMVLSATEGQARADLAWHQAYDAKRNRSGLGAVKLVAGTAMTIGAGSATVAAGPAAGPGGAMATVCSFELAASGLYQMRTDQDDPDAIPSVENSARTALCLAGMREDHARAESRGIADDVTALAVMSAAEPPPPTCLLSKSVCNFDAAVAANTAASTTRFFGNSIAADITVQNGVATVDIGYAASLESADIEAIKQIALSNGATSGVINTGEVINSDLALNLGQRAAQGRTLFGGVVKDLSANGVNKFQITFGSN